jgi:hypothetical protein
MTACPPQDPPTRPGASAAERGTTPPRLSDELALWLESDGDKTLGGLIAFFGKRAFAIVFLVLLGVPALPLPTGGATHLFEMIAVVLALELVLGRDEIWLPQRWGAVTLAADGRLFAVLMRALRRLERISRPRLRLAFGHRLSNVIFGLLVASGSVAAFLAPPFTGLDTLPALGVVLLALGVLLEDFMLVVLGVIVGVAGVGLEIVVGGAAFRGLKSLV